MVTELKRKTPRWSRWARLVHTSPSGKSTFVCLICGDVTPSPGNECPRREREVRLDLRARHWLPEWTSTTCRDVEAHINEAIEAHIDKELVLNWAEDQLKGRSHPEHKCQRCHGYGCQECLGRGTHW